MNGLDYSFARPGGAAIKAAGYGFVCRYLASASGKRIEATEVTDLRGNQLALVLVFEDYATQALNGQPQGVADAQEALSQANAIGWPAERPIYFAVDFDATEAQQTAINAYFDGVASVIGLARTGGYAGYWVIKRLLDAGKITFAWQTLAWSGGNVDPRIHIYQNGQSAFNGGADVDESRQVDFGQWGDTVMLMNKDQAVCLAKRLALLAGMSEAEITADWLEYQSNQIMANIEYAAGLALQLYNGPEWQNLIYKGVHYDELAAEISSLQKQVADKPQPTPAPAPATPTVPTVSVWQSFINWLTGKK